MRTRDDWQAIAASITPRTGIWVDGAATDAADARTFPTTDPATGATIAHVARGGEADVDRAVRSARRAFDDGAWSRSDPADRKRVLLRLADLIRGNADELAVLDSLDGGKLIGDTTSVDVPGSAAILQWYAESVDKVYGEIAPVSGADLALVTREPVGVVGAVIPWNYPLEMAIWKVAPALAAGNSVVLKPAEETPLSALRLAELATAAGLPDGVLNVVPGLGREAGAALGLHPDVDVITFTGSTAVGKLFLEYAGRSTMKAVWLECGGKSANLVFPDVADLDAAAARAAAGIFACSGQVCSANSRLLVHRSIAAEMGERIAAIARDLTVGHPFDPASRMGPLVSETQRRRVDDAVTAGAASATLLAGGPSAGEGCFVPPTVLADVDPADPLFTDEIFGPVLAITPFDTEEEAIALANRSEYGLAASVFTDDLRRAVRVSRRLRVGTVSVNTVDALDVTTPFGGVKQSGFGRDLSLHAMDKFTALKTTWIAGG
ncbi:aldehyde dehydrogenase [Litorihabitans aurantiacus]|uniref:Aldehyde dehydrogenase n=1 Tax=Litorihabitans aurantiacus TaxID=1930061 RepID=A0AA37XG36_9MICO|nr:aldehyde dehydrogenase [Litorihabitans aurantiacus]GMA32565.1 aldehyde dehydrogenase [Litorihabitans aurantiacus]